MSDLLKKFNSGERLSDDDLIHLKRHLEIYSNKDHFDKEWILHKNLTRFEHSLFLNGVHTKLDQVNNMISARSEK